jgi:hypothetical protein
MIGDRADATGVTVQSVVTRNGFWIGSRSLRVWVELVGPLKPLHIEAGDRLRFSGTMAGNGSSYAQRAGLSGPDAVLLNREGAHIDVKTTDIQVRAK